ncbi:MAG: hypothetical protein AAF737_04130 [Pseudomonadota bacterium]
MSAVKPFVGPRQMLMIYSHGGDVRPEMHLERGPMSMTEALHRFLQFDSGFHRAYIVETDVHGEAELDTERPDDVSVELCERWITEAFAGSDERPRHVPDFIKQHARKAFEQAEAEWAEDRDTYSHSPWRNEHRIGHFEAGTGRYGGFGR